MEPFCRRIFPRGQEFQSHLHRIGYGSGRPTMAVFRLSASAASRSSARPLRCRAIAWTRTGTSSTIIRGSPDKHDIKFGYEFRRTTIKQVIDHNFRGTLDLSTTCTDFLEGTAGWRRPNHRQYPAAHFGKQSRRLYSGQLPAHPAADFQLGLRWDYFGVVGEKEQSPLSVSIPRMAAARCKSPAVRISTIRTTTTSHRAWPSPTT